MTKPTYAQPGENANNPFSRHGLLFGTDRTDRRRRDRCDTGARVVRPPAPPPLMRTARRLCRSAHRVAALNEGSASHEQA